MSGLQSISLSTEDLGALRHVIWQEQGLQAGNRTLNRIGLELGSLLGEEMSSELGDDPLATDLELFWGHLDRLLSTKGWGRVMQQTPHSAIGLLRTSQWAETKASGDRSRRSPCAVSAGLLAGILTKVVGRQVAVLEIADAEEASPTFAFGSEYAIRSFADSIREEGSVERAFQSLRDSSMHREG